jgi:SHAQKYF class myb-like DNA-binding protein
MISPVAVVSEDVSDLYPAGQEWQGGEKTSVIPSSQVESTSTPPSSLGKLSPVISHPDLPSDADEGGDESNGSAMPTAVAPARSNGSHPDAYNQAIPFVDNEPRPNKVSSMEHSTKLNVAVDLTFQQSQGKPSESGSNVSPGMSTSGRWTAAEHEAFLRGLKVYGREWKKVATCVPTRTSAQIRSHAQKYFAKASKEQEHFLTSTEHHIPLSVETFPLCDRPMPESYADKLDSIMRDSSEVETQVCTTLVALRERYKQLQDRLLQVQDSSSCKLLAEPGDAVQKPESAQSGNVVMGPATAALELEQKSLRTAAEARYEMKRKRPVTFTEDTDSSASSCPFVSCVSLKSTFGVFDSSDVIALSMLGGNLGRERIENKTISTIKDEHSLNLVIERLESTKNND